MATKRRASGSNHQPSLKDAAAVKQRSVARFGIHCPAAPGHINPMSAVARELGARGHAIVFMGFPDVRAKLGEDLDFVSYGEEAMPPGTLQAFIDRISGVGGALTADQMMSEAAGVAEIVLRELPDAIEAARPDALILDQIEPAPHMVARAMQIPFATVANAFHMNAEPAVPPPMVDWPYDPSPAAVQRNLGAYRALGAVRQPITRVIRGYGRRFGFSDFRLVDEIWSEICQVTQCLRSFDFPRQQLPPSFHYCGPFRDPEPPLEFELPNDGRPLVFCSLGSLQGSRARLFHNVCAAAVELDLNLLIAHGGRMSDAQAAALSGKPMVHSYVPQRAVLARSALAVTHAGLNTVLDSLSNGTPMVAMPITFEQPGIAARLQRAGAGEVLHQQRATPMIKAAMEQVLEKESYRANAHRMAEEIRSAGGAKRAADLSEDALGLRGPAPATGAEISARS
jgi:zeaxanthin glucosyltransferase